MMFSTPALTAPNEMPSNNPPVEPGVQNDKPSRPGLAGRSHLENQERAYVAASRRSDRTLDARYLSAQMASKIHKDRTGKAFKLSMEIVEHEEMYEEEDGEMSSMKLLDSEAKTAKSQLSEKLDSWIHGKNTVLNLIANSEPRERYDVVNQIFSHTYPSMASGSTGHGQPFDPCPPMAAQMMHGSQSQHGIQAQQGVQGQQGIGDTLDFQSRYRMMQSARAMEGQQFGRDSRPASQRDGPPAARPSSSSPPKSATLQRPGIFRADSTPNLGLSNPASPLGSLHDAAYLDSNTGSTSSSYHSSFSNIGMEQKFNFGVGTGAVTPGTPMNFVSGADTFTGALPYSTAMLVNPGGLPADVQGGLSGRPIGTAGPAMPVQPSQGGFLGGNPHMGTGQQQHGGRMPLYGTQQAQYRQRVPVQDPVPGQGPVLHPQHAQGQGPTHGLQQGGVLAPQDWAQFVDRHIQSSQVQQQQQQQIHEGLDRGYVNRQLNQFLQEKELRQRRQQLQQQQLQQVIEGARERQQQLYVEKFPPQSEQSQRKPTRHNMEMAIQRLHQEQQQQFQLNLEKKVERRLRRLKDREQKEQQQQQQKEQEQQQQKEQEQQQEQQQQQQDQMELDKEQLPQDQVQQDKPKRRKTRAPRLQSQQSPQQKSRVQKPKSQKSKPTQQKLKLQQQHQVLQIQEQMQQVLRIREQQNQPQQEQEQELLEEQPQEQSQSPQPMQSLEPQEQQQAQTHPQLEQLRAQPHLQPEQQQGLSQLWDVEDILDGYEHLDECEDELERSKKAAEPESPSGGPLGGESAEQAVPDLDDVAWSLFINEAIFSRNDP